VRYLFTAHNDGLADNAGTTILPPQLGPNAAESAAAAPFNGSERHRKRDCCPLHWIRTPPKARLLYLPPAVRRLVLPFPLTASTCFPKPWPQKFPTALTSVNEFCVKKRSGNLFRSASTCVCGVDDDKLLKETCRHVEQISLDWL